VGYSLRATMVYLVTVISSRYKTKKNIIFIIPLILCSFLSIISIFPFSKGIVFSFSKNNYLVRGPFGFFPHLLCGFYAIQIIYYSLKNYQHNRFEPVVIILIEIASFTAMFIEHCLGYDFVLSQTLITSVIFYYFFLLTQTYKRDTLTSFFNRRCFYLQLNHLLKEKIIILSMDLNNLKKINDNLGHAEGDKAIITVAQEMRKNFLKNTRIYRTGGDEFMAIFRKKDIAFVENLVKKFQESLKSTKFRVACGIAQYNPGEDINKTITLCDERMYTNKEKIKKEETVEI